MSKTFDCSFSIISLIGDTSIKAKSLNSATRTILKKHLDENKKDQRLIYLRFYLKHKNKKHHYKIVKRKNEWVVLPASG